MTLQVVFPPSRTAKLMNSVYPVMAMASSKLAAATTVAGMTACTWTPLVSLNNPYWVKRFDQAGVTSRLCQQKVKTLHRAGKESQGTQQ